MHVNIPIINEKKAEGNLLLSNKNVRMFFFPTAEAQGEEKRVGNCKQSAKQSRVSEMINVIIPI